MARFVWRYKRAEDIDWPSELQEGLDEEADQVRSPFSPSALI